MNNLATSNWAVPKAKELKAYYERIGLEELIKTHGTPLMVLDLERVRQQWRALRELMPMVQPHYAVKALSHEAVLETLRDEGAWFDVATVGEVEMMKTLGIAPERCIYTNPINKAENIAAAVEYGIRTFVFDNEAELAKFVPVRDNVELLLRLSYRNPEAVVDLSYKFGAQYDEALKLMKLARERGLRVRGVSFHPGGQSLTVEPLVHDIERSLELMAEAKTQGLELDVLDIGGGLPVPQDMAVPSVEEFAAAVRQVLAPAVAQGIKVWSEPGRFVAAPAVTAVTSVVGQNHRSGASWYYLDDGMYGSFSNIMSDHARPSFFALKAVMSQVQMGLSACVLAGPTCDSIDVMTTNAMMPRLEVGDAVVSPMMGAYTVVTTAEFNAIPKPKVVVI